MTCGERGRPQSPSLCAPCSCQHSSFYQEALPVLGTPGVLSASNRSSSSSASFHRLCLVNSLAMQRTILAHSHTLTDYLKQKIMLQLSVLYNNNNKVGLSEFGGTSRVLLIYLIPKLLVTFLNR